MGGLAMGLAHRVPKDQAMMVTWGLIMGQGSNRLHAFVGLRMDHSPAANVRCGYYGASAFVPRDGIERMKCKRCVRLIAGDEARG